MLICDLNISSNMEYHLPIYKKIDVKFIIDNYEIHAMRNKF